MAAEDARGQHDVYPGDDDLNFAETEKPVPHPSDFTLYATVEARTATFEGNWHPTGKPRPTAMSQAGFFYLGPGDKVICFSCKLELKRWKKNSDPLAEHKMYADEREEECEYLNGLQLAQ